MRSGTGLLYVGMVSGGLGYHVLCSWEVEVEGKIFLAAANVGIDIESGGADGFASPMEMWTTLCSKELT